MKKQLDKPLRRVLAGGLWLLVAAWGLSGCAVHLMSGQDPKTIERVENFSDDLNHLLFQLEETGERKPDCLYKTYKAEYTRLKVQLNAIVLHEEARLRNEQTSQQVSLLRDNLNELVNLHKQGCLPPGVVQINQNQFNSMLGGILKLENSKQPSQTGLLN